MLNLTSLYVRYGPLRLSRPDTERAKPVKTRHICYAILAAFLFACRVRESTANTPAATGAAAQPLVIAPAPGFVAGSVFFHSPRFGTNDRSCATCHIAPSFSISPGQVELLHSLDPESPLFRPIDSDDGVGTSYSRLRSRATFRIEIALAPNVEVSPHDGDVRVGADGVTYVTVRRSPITSVNSTFEGHLMWDGREGSDLSQQALSAIRAHAQPNATTEPNQPRLDMIANFQRALFSRPELREYARDSSHVPQLPDHQPDGSPLTAAQARGRQQFVSGPLPGGKCAQCHSGPMLNEINAFNFFQPAGSAFSNNELSERNDDHNPTHVYTFHIPASEHPLGFTEVTLESPDPGRIALTGHPCEVPLACVINAFVIPFDPSSGINTNHMTQSLFRISSLWGVNDTAPYFHDHSAPDLQHVLQHYQRFFHVTAVGTGDPRYEISDAEAADIIEFVRLL